MSNDLEVLACSFYSIFSYEEFVVWREKAMVLLKAAHNPDYQRWLPLGLQDKTMKMIENLIKILSRIDILQEVSQDNFKHKRGCYRRRHRHRRRHHHRHPPTSIGFDVFHKVDTTNMGYTWRFHDAGNISYGEGSFIPWDGKGSLIAIEGQTSHRGPFPPIDICFVQGNGTEIVTLNLTNEAGMLTCDNEDYISQKIESVGPSTYFWTFHDWGRKGFHPVDVNLSFVFAE